MCTPWAAKLSLHKRDTRVRVVNTEILKMLHNDVFAIEHYRANSHHISVETIKVWFPGVQDIESAFKWLQPERDFIYTADGLHILKEGYLREKEPLQYAMLRIAKLYSGGDSDHWHIMYDLFSCGMIHALHHSAPAPAEQPCDSNVSGETCRVDRNDYHRNMKVQAKDIITSSSSYVGVGYGASNVPRYGHSSTGKIRRGGFKPSRDELNTCNYIKPVERKSESTLFIHMHSDTILEVLKVIVPTKKPLDNIFVGLMVSDHFMQCVKFNKDWYLFDEATTFNGKSLADYAGAEYVEMYDQWVNAKLYSARYSAYDIMTAIIQSIMRSNVQCKPYIIWLDTSNRYNNQNHLGIMKTLSLGNEVTKDSDFDNSSMTPIMSCNMAMYKDFPGVMDRVQSFIIHKYGVQNLECDDFDLPELAVYAYRIGYMSTVALNNFMGENRRKREIGLSPLGVYDMALLADEEPVKVCSIISEALYKGAIQSSCDQSGRSGARCENYNGSEFSKGNPQFILRSHDPSSDWSLLRRTMQDGMLNSMLTMQSGTGSASLLTGVTPSVSLPMVISNAIEVRKCLNYGIMYRFMNTTNFEIIPYDVDAQLAMYRASLGFIDYTQSTIFTTNFDMQEISNLLVETYNAELKTGIYFLLCKQQRLTFDAINTKK